MSRGEAGEAGEQLERQTGLTAGRMSAGDAIADAIRSSIVSGQLAPGGRLKEDQVAEEFGVSRVPVREAIRRLEVEGYVTVTLNAGARVAVPSSDDAAELLQIRTALEVLAARLAASRRGAGRLDALAAVLADGETAAADERYDDLAELSARFHELIIEASANTNLIRVLKEIRAKLTWIWMVDIESRAPASWAAHHEIFAAISAADIERAATAMAGHLELDEIATDGSGPT